MQASNHSENSRLNISNQLNTPTIKNNRKIVIILQARMGSTRLPGKPLKKVMGKALLSYQIERLRRISLVDDIIIATSILPSDDPIIDFCIEENVTFFRGNELDVLDRYYHAAKANEASIVVRVTGDCPLIDPLVVDALIQFYLNSQASYDYVSNTLIPTYPRGLDAEIFSFRHLELAFLNAKTPEEREHVTPYFYLRPNEFLLGNFACYQNYSYLRLTVDEPSDLELITKIFTELYPRNPYFNLEDIVKLMNKYPEWKKINAHVEQKKLTAVEKKRS